MQFGCPEGWFGTSFWEHVGYLGEHFGGLGMSWERVGIMVTGWLATGILGIRPVEGNLLVWQALTVNRSSWTCDLRLETDPQLDL